MSAELGSLKRVDAREVWKHEAHDFTPWLVDNIELLGECLGMELEVLHREAAVGDFSVDILARDLGRGRTVVIENQLEVTDHSHLGQLITYAAGNEAGTVIWVSREFREEHRQALDWLNRGDGATTEYFGVVLELLQVDDSKPAVNFRLVAKPNDWSRQTKLAANTEEPSGKMQAYQQFFQRLIDELREKHHYTNARVGQPQNWYSFSAGTTGFQYTANFGQGNKLRVGLYIDPGDEAENESAFEALAAQKEAIEQEYGEPLAWERLDSKRACRISSYASGSIDAAADQQEQHRKWMIDRLLRLKKVFGPRVAKLSKS